MTKSKNKNEAAPPGPAPRLIDIKEASKLWNLPVTAIRKKVHAGKLRPFVGFKSWRFLETDILGALERL
ncbi:helix-turn-helix domain-containing protein [Haloferula sp. BvORR071]|uniref:helix-turn-helix domain-containing protein n=1 Tax=Haloferula sp. BvORR071 TaxID=1396141 RepID=UPI000552722D|nr:helix-turn-helix domain-containing protein [Haloferula sp. BvORR071]